MTTAANINRKYKAHVHTIDNTKSVTHIQNGQQQKSAKKLKKLK